MGIAENGTREGRWAIDERVATAIAAAHAASPPALSLAAGPDPDPKPPRSESSRDRRWRLFALAVDSDDPEAMWRDQRAEGEMDPGDWRPAALAVILGRPESLSWLLSRGAKASTPSGMSIAEWAGRDALESIGFWPEGAGHARCARALAVDPSWRGLSEEALVDALASTRASMESMIMGSAFARSADDPDSARRRQLEFFEMESGWLEMFDAAWGMLGDEARAKAPAACRRMCEIAIDPWLAKAAADAADAGADALRRWIAAAKSKDWRSLEERAQGEGWSLSQCAMEWTSRTLGLQGLPWPHGERAIREGWEALSGMLGQPAWRCPGVLDTKVGASQGAPWRLSGIGGAGVALVGLVGAAGDFLHPGEAVRVLSFLGTECDKEAKSRAARPWAAPGETEGRIGAELAALHLAYSGEPGMSEALGELCGEWERVFRFGAEPGRFAMWGEKLALAAASLPAEAPRASRGTRL